MLTHLNEASVKPKRVVILGARGFVGAAATQRLEKDGISVLALGRQDLDLMAGGASEKLINTLTPEDSLLVISAEAPVKNTSMLVDNIQMMETVCQALESVTPNHVVYISSDAVYADSKEPLTEASSAEPGSLHGVMHLARELMLRHSCNAPIAMLRPTLLYGAADPHNGYGPNQYRRLAAEGKEIGLFGKGEERRDHVLIDDVAEIIYRVITHCSEGILNVATGKVTSFYEIADMVLSHFADPVEISYRPRSGPMPHDGYRPFDSAACKQAFGDFTYTSLADGVAKTHRDMMENK